MFKQIKIVQINKTNKVKFGNLIQHKKQLNLEK